MKSRKVSQARLRGKLDGRKDRCSKKGERSKEQSDHESDNWIYRALVKLSSAVFEVWKTFPEPTKTVVLMIILTSATALIWTRPPTPVSPAPEQTKSDSNENSKVIDTSVVERRSEEKTHHSTSRVSRINSPDETKEQTVTTSNDLSPATSQAEETLSRGTYAEAYRQFRKAAEGFPDKQKRKFLQQLQEGDMRYKRGDFREAAYQLRRVVASNSL